MAENGLSNDPFSHMAEETVPCASMEVSEERGRGALRRPANGGPLLIAIRGMDMISPPCAFRTAAPSIDLDVLLEARIQSRALLPTDDRHHGLVVEVRVVESV